MQSPGTIEIEIKIEPTTDTEELRVTAESGGHYRSSSIWLEGKDSQKVHTCEWHGFPAGDYEVTGELIAASGRREVVVRGALPAIASYRTEWWGCAGGGRSPRSCALSRSSPG